MIADHASKVLVTGATGLVGNALVPALLSAGWRVRATARQLPAVPWATHANCEFLAHDLDAGGVPAQLLEDVAAVVHLAARVHIMRDRAADPLQENRRINTQATLSLARTASQLGIRHFVFASTIKVNGECTTDRPYSEADSPRPEDAYALSKWEAEQGLSQLASASSMSVTVIRPPLIYGPGVKGNFASLLRAIERGLPLPLGSVRNRRSLVYAGNLADAIVATLERAVPGHRVYLISDNEDLSTPELIRTIAAALHRPARLIPVPPGLLRLAGKATGRSAAVSRLLQSLAVDSSLIRKELGWTPPYNLAQGLAETLRHRGRL